MPSTQSGMLHEGLLDFCETDRQREIIKACIDAGSIEAGIRELKLNRSTVQRAIKAVRARAALHGYSPEHGLNQMLPMGFIADRLSLNVVDGENRQHWIKAKVSDIAKAEILERAARAMADDLPRYRPIKTPKTRAKDLLNLYVLTDCHVGALAWQKEGGADWNLEIAERTLTGCFQLMLERSPSTDTCLIAQLGDWLHYDSHLPVTPTHGHILDSAGRPGQVVDAAIRTLRRIVDAALEKHRRVVLLIAEGNHDIQSSLWLRRLFGAAYEKEKRLEIIQSETPYYTYQHGRTMLSFHHGHMKKLEELAAEVPALFPALWGATEWRYLHGGHHHHLKSREFPGLYFEQHPTLAARDSHTSRHAYLAGRRASSITYHTQHGESGRVVVTPEMLEAA